ncbi:iron-containing alcohol dehydrogenase [Hoeflea sp.]|uniref:iron-containing alcohol dehydrogenase n=1 Tax=Hoeflea sp. TaxID=1940281 RepID=UPI0019C07E35|nr:iron-containing alcohol dehydrogenase [Hoeflea sp.]MBC7282965.1 iron-containing alcohol dehydrogenase [Hoeflea sp.]
MTFQKGLGAIHALSHALGGLREPGLHHGTLNATLLPGAKRINRDAAPGRMVRIECALGIKDGGLAAALSDLNARLEIPKRLRSLGARDRHVDYAIERATADHSHATNPRPPTCEHYRHLILETMI